VQFRILQEVQAHRQSVASTGDDRTPLPAPPLAYLQEAPDPSDVLPTIISHHNDRFVQDYHQDSADLRCIIRNALSSNSDAHLIEVLQLRPLLLVFTHLIIRPPIGAASSAARDGRGNKDSATSTRGMH
jgi:hypothetical protein